jgi:ligand-binding sensor domain-containing protein
VVYDPANLLKLYAGIDNAGIYFSVDGGATWTSATIQPANNRIKALVLKPGDSTTLFAATYGGGVFTSSNSAVTWGTCSNSSLTNLNVVSLAMDVTGKLYAGTEAGVFVSTDNCASWTAVNSGLPN